MSSRPTTRDRYSFANLDEALALPDLIAIQRESFNWFVSFGLADTFRDISPIKDFTETLQLELEFDPDDEDLRPEPKFSVEECKEKDMTFSAPIFVRARFMNAQTGEIKEQTVFWFMNLARTKIGAAKVMSFSLHSSTENFGSGRRSSSSGSNSSSSWSVSVKSLMGLMSRKVLARPCARNQSKELRWMAMRSGSSRTSSRFAKE